MGAGNITVQLLRLKYLWSINADKPHLFVATVQDNFQRVPVHNPRDGGRVFCKGQDRQAQSQQQNKQAQLNAAVTSETGHERKVADKERHKKGV